MKKLQIIFLFSLLASFSLFADQIVTSTAPEYIDSEIELTNSNQSATVVAQAPTEDLIAQLYYNGSSLEDGTIISQDSNNEVLLLSESWELTPFSIRVTGSELSDISLNIALEVGFFQLLDEYGNIAQGENGYIIDSQTMEIENISSIAGVNFYNTPLGSNLYNYTIPLTQNNYYSLSTMANFKLTWQGKDILQPGNYISNIQVTFSIN